MWHTAESVLVRAVIVRADLALAIHQDEACTMGDGRLCIIVWMRAVMCQRRRRGEPLPEVDAPPSSFWNCRGRSLRPLRLRRQSGPA